MLDLISQETDSLPFGPGEFRLTENEDSDYLEKCRRKENCLYLIAFLDETVIGTLSFEAGTRPRIQHAGEFGISVLKKSWGIGVASALIDSLLEWSIDGNIIRKINLSVRADNHRAITLYKQKGFVVEGTRKKEIHIKGYFLRQSLDGIRNIGIWGSYGPERNPEISMMVAIFMSYNS